MGNGKSNAKRTELTKHEKVVGSMLEYYDDKDVFHREMYNTQEHLISELLASQDKSELRFYDDEGDLERRVYVDQKEGTNGTELYHKGKLTGAFYGYKDKDGNECTDFIGKKGKLLKTTVKIKTRDQETGQMLEETITRDAKGRLLSQIIRDEADRHLIRTSPTGFWARLFGRPVQTKVVEISPERAAVNKKLRQILTDTSLKNSLLKREKLAQAVSDYRRQVHKPKRGGR